MCQSVRWQECCGAGNIIQFIAFLICSNDILSDIIFLDDNSVGLKGMPWRLASIMVVFGGNKPEWLGHGHGWARRSIF